MTNPVSLCPTPLLWTDLSEAHDGGAEAPLGSPASQPKRRSNMRRGSVLAMTPNPLSAAAGAGAGKDGCGNRLTWCVRKILVAHTALGMRLTCVCCL